jgi:hypothetical protein
MKVFKHLQLWVCMRKGVMILVLVGLLILMSFNPAEGQSAGTYAEEIADAYFCLDDGIGKSPSLSLEEAIFAALAEVDDESVMAKIEDEKSLSEECWPRSGCKIMETAQVSLVRQMQGEDVSGIISWLKSKSGAIQGLNWFLQITIDDNKPAECIISYAGNEYNIQVKDDLTLEGSPGSCLEFAQSGYWLRIKDSCIDNSYEVNCGGDFSEFKTNLLYRRGSEETVFISTLTNRKSANAWTVEEINAQCFKEGTQCDYEASLWATTALYAAREDTRDYAPYLRALSGGQNDKYFPSAFLFHILEETSGSGDEYNKILQNKRPGGLWNIGGSPYNKFYDTALAMLALGSGRGGANSPDLIDSTVPGLFKDQSDNGCWGSLRDTAFLLYSSGWKRGEQFGGEEICTEDSDCEEGEECVDNICVADINCSVEGESTDLNVDCCTGLTELDDVELDSNDVCIDNGGVYGVCSNCGDGVCSAYEDVCSCMDDCAEEIEPEKCVGGFWYTEGSESPINTTETVGYCHNVDDVDGWADGCCVTGYECIGIEEDSICEEKLGKPTDVQSPNVCFNGDWYDENSVRHDTKTEEGYCHLDDDSAYGCCPADYRCEFDAGNETESLCKRVAPTGPTTPKDTECESAGYYCVADEFTCIVDAKGNPKNFICQNHFEACCDENVPPIEGCFAQEGEICAFNEECSGGSLQSSDIGICCTDECISTGEDECSSNSDCSGDEVCRSGECVTVARDECTLDDDCLDGETCESGSCVAGESGWSVWIWVILFGGLIVLVILGIVFKDKLRVMIFKMKGKAKTSKVPPRGNIPITHRRTPPRFGSPTHRRPVARRPLENMRPVGRSKDDDDTFKKLREMSK